ncbi:MAG: hypothetical protein K0R17_3385, partial [Rariglobus sp.]|nr:hypothetical protein [Rariglobus sp.]
MSCTCTSYLLDKPGGTFSAVTDLLPTPG